MGGPEEDGASGRDGAGDCGASLGLLTQVFAKSDEREAAFRFVRNDDISALALMDAAHSRTARRCAEHPFVFVAVDQTDLSIV